MTYLVISMRLGQVRRDEWLTVMGAQECVREMRKAGWAVTVLEALS